jgi:hypothetical protein
MERRFVPQELGEPALLATALLPQVLSLVAQAQWEAVALLVPEGVERIVQAARDAVVAEGVRSAASKDARARRNFGVRFFA